MKTFVQALLGLRHWFGHHNMHPRDGESPVKITIEVPSPRVGATVLFQLKAELDGLGGQAWTLIDFDRPMRILGMEVEFKIKDQQPMPAAYRRNLPAFTE